MDEQSESTMNAELCITLGRTPTTKFASPPVPWQTYSTAAACQTNPKKRRQAESKTEAAPKSRSSGTSLGIDLRRGQYGAVRTADPPENHAVGAVRAADGEPRP